MSSTSKRIANNTPLTALLASISVFVIEAIVFRRDCLVGFVPLGDISLVYHRGMKTAVVAMDRNRAIGFNNDLPWGRSLKDDLTHFKRLTTNGSIIMGRKTFESIGSRPLPNRENIVLSRNPTAVANTLTALSPSAAYDLARYPIFVIGGGQIFEQTIDDMDQLVVTYVDAEFPEATIFFPQINCQVWEEVSRDHHEADERNAYAFDIVTYKRILDS